MNQILVLVIKIYQRTLSKILFNLFGNGCRFSPTCSEYAIESLNEHGVIKGVQLTTVRILKCHPFSKANYFDPVPKKVQYK